MNTVFCKFCFVFIPLKSGELGAKIDQSRRTGEESFDSFDSFAFSHL